MVKRYVTNNIDGTIAITAFYGSDPDATRLAQTFFEISRTTDMTSHFDPAVHTLEVIAAGIEGHRALALVGECEDTDLPTDEYFRNAWEWED